MFSLLSVEVASSVRTFLETILPQLDENWWNRHVVPALSFQQQRTVKNKSISSLSGLDLAALLRVVDKNWYEISGKYNLTHETRNWVRELQQIRNRWAHSAGHPPSPEDVYRDLDTLQRFLTAINAAPNLLEQIRQRKQGALPNIHSPQEVPPVTLPPQKEQPTSEFVPGDMVRLNSNPETSGVILQVFTGTPENRYLVFINNQPQQYYASQLEDLALDATPDLLDLEAFHACLTAMHLKHPGLASLYSLHAARIDYIPYQFKPVMKLIHSDRPRLLIADEVGVGKTIEAGLILRELQSRCDLDSVLIICPRPLVTEQKWRTEMKRFDEDFEHLDGPLLHHCLNETDLDGVWPEKHNRAIVPFSLFDEELLTGTPGSSRRRAKKGLFDLDPPPKFDLIIVDEAHHLRNPTTCLHRAVSYFCDNAEAVVFLTATPIQLGLQDLFVQLNILRPDLIIDQATFEHMAEPNPFINQTIELARNNGENWQQQAKEYLNQAASTGWGNAVLQNNPEFQYIYDQLSDEPLDNDKRVSFIHKVEELHTFSTMINRTRRRDIGDFTKRSPETIEVPFTPIQKSLHDDLLAMQARILVQIHGNNNLLFMMTTIRRQAASCLYGLAPLIGDILTRRIDDLDLTEIDDTFDGEIVELGSLEDQIIEIMERADNLDASDPKLEALLKIIQDKQQLSNNKILIFSSFRHTLAYLEKHLSEVNLRIGYIHGGTPDEMRREQRFRFSLPQADDDAIDILLSSEVGCEGLDYQFCDCLVNYDLPWNPMRVEQRIGRIDRYGQQSESVAIYNLVTPGTVDADIYNRCLWRIGVFHSALGGSEEILGTLTREIKGVADSLSLTSEERQMKLERLVDNEIRWMQEQAKLEESQAELFGLRLPQQAGEEDVAQAESYWLTPKALHLLIETYLEKSCGHGQEQLLGDGALKTLRVGKEGREVLLKDFRQLPKKISPLYRQWEKWLKGSEQHLTITFDADCAKGARKETVFITPIHPFALQAASYLTPSKRIAVSFRVKSSDIPEGKYPFTIYQWQKKGVREDVVFQPVCADKSVSKEFMRLLCRGESIDVELPPDSIVDELDVKHQELWSTARLVHQVENCEIIHFRKESLRTSHSARLTLLKTQMDSAKEEKIRRMRKAQIDNADADFNRRLAELDLAETQLDIHSQPVAVGMMVVEKS